jgi:hypothetical protein
LQRFKVEVLVEGAPLAVDAVLEPQRPRMILEPPQVRDTALIAVRH